MRVLTLTLKQVFGEPERFLNKRIRVEGWVRTIRVSKAFGFIELNDGTFFTNLQIVFEEALSNYGEIARLNVGAALSVDGELVESGGAKQKFELKAAEIRVEGTSGSDYPLQKKKALL